MSSYLDHLKLASRQLGIKVPGSHLISLSRNPDVVSGEQVKDLLTSLKVRKVTRDQVKQLEQLIHSAKQMEGSVENQSEQHTPDQEQSEESPDLEQGAGQASEVDESDSYSRLYGVDETPTTGEPSNETKIVDENPSEIAEHPKEADYVEEPSTSVENSELEIGTPQTNESDQPGEAPEVTATEQVESEVEAEQAEIEQAEIEQEEDVSMTRTETAPTLDLSQYSNIDAFYEPDRPVEVIITKQGTQLDLAWPDKDPFDGEVFLLAADKSGFPTSPSKAAQTWLTQESAITISSESKFFTLFSFESQGAVGVRIGSGRVMGEGNSLQVEEYQNQIRMSWETDDPESTVCVVRSEPNQDLPQNPPRSMRLALEANSMSFIDRDVIPGEEYEYRVFLEWKSPTGQILASPGIKRKIAVQAPVPQVKGFTVKRIDQSPDVSIQFETPETPAKVRVFQTRGLPKPELLAARDDGDEKDVSLLDSESVKEWLGTEIIDLPQVEENKMTMTAPMLAGEVDSRTYVAISVLGKKMRISEVEVVQQVGQIDQLELVDRYDYQLLRVARPTGAQILEVWAVRQGVSFDQASLETPRKVQLDEEYRRFGGVLFSSSVSGYPGMGSLSPEPQTIYVRGVSIFSGRRHEGPWAEFNYEGRVVIQYKTAKIARTAQDNSGFKFGRKKPQQVQDSTNALVFRTTTPAQFERSITLQHLSGAAFPLGQDDENTKVNESIELRPREFNEWSVYKSEQGAPRQFQPGIHHRLLAITDGNSGKLNGSPCFVVDGRVDDFSAWRQGGNALNADLRVVLLGAKQSGKTTYTQALLNYLDRNFSQLFEAKLLPESGNEHAAERLRSMNEFILTGNLPEGTKTARPFVENQSQHIGSSQTDPTKPLTFELDNGGDVPLRRITITDVAGEDMDTVDTMSFYEEAITSADLLIFIADPLQIGAVQNAMAGLPLPPKGTDPFLVMKNLNQLLEQTDMARNPTQKLAVVMSKLDSFEELCATPESPVYGAIQPGMSITRDPNSNSKNIYNYFDGSMTELEILGILGKLGISPFIRLVENSFERENRRFFVVSSLGHARHAAQMDSAGISSLRISDPIRWAIHTWGK